MQHLRLVGVHEDGLHLLLADDEGNRFTVPLDEALRAAARRDRPRLGQLQIEISGGLRPKDVQAMIRAGMTAEEVAERAGWSVEKVHRYEGPILAEREHVAGLARQVRLRPRGGSHGGAPTLDARVAERLRTREIDADSAQWDSRRTDKGAWTVLLLFNAGGRQREAAWRSTRSPAPCRRSTTRPAGSARTRTSRHRAPSPPRTCGVHPSEPRLRRRGRGRRAARRPPRRREGETVDLMAAMRERSAQRGRRRRPKSTEVPGLDEAPEEALPLEEVARDPRDELPPPAHTHPEDDPEVVKTGTVEERVGAEAAQRKVRRTEPTQPVRQVPSSPAEADSASPVEAPAHPPAEPEALVVDDETDGHADEHRRHRRERRHRARPTTSSSTTSSTTPARQRRVPWTLRPRTATRTSTRRVPSPRHTTSPCSRSGPSVRQCADGRSRSRCPARQQNAAVAATTPRGHGVRHLRRGRRRPRDHRGAPTGSAGEADSPPRAGGAQVRPAERAELGRHHVRPQERVT